MPGQKSRADMERAVREKARWEKLLWEFAAELKTYRRLYREAKEQLAKAVAEIERLATQE